MHKFSTFGALKLRKPIEVLYSRPRSVNRVRTQDEKPVQEHLSDASRRNRDDQWVFSSLRLSALLVSCVASFPDYARPTGKSCYC